MYAVIDIEATNGKPGDEKVIDIAIYKFNGEEVIDRFASLVNPEQKIGFYVERLTGITNKMVRTAPKFYELAKRILEILEGCVLVGHNIAFDYRMLQQEFISLGYEIKMDCIDTLVVSQELISDESSYNLGKLCKSLGIPHSSRHRAEGDAKATLELFKILYSKDNEKLMQSRKSMGSRTSKVAKRHLELLRELPTATGVYYFLNQQNNIIYIGKSLNIKQRVNQHFTGHDKKSRKIIETTSNVRFEITGSELLALIKESHEIKLHQPKYNRAKKRSFFAYGIFEEIDKAGYKCLKVKKLSKNKDPLLSFSSYESAKRSLFRITDEHHFCQKLNGLYKTESSCFAYQIEECAGACVGEESVEDYNQRFDEWKSKWVYPFTQFLLIDKGRNEQEQTFFLIKDGVFRGYGFFEYDHQIKTLEVVNHRMTPIPETRDMKQMIRSFIFQGKLRRYFFDS